MIPQEDEQLVKLLAKNRVVNVYGDDTVYIPETVVRSFKDGSVRLAGVKNSNEMFRIVHDQLFRGKAVELTSLSMMAALSGLQVLIIFDSSCAFDLVETCRMILDAPSGSRVVVVSKSQQRGCDQYVDACQKIDPYLRTKLPKPLQSGHRSRLEVFLRFKLILHEAGGRLPHDELERRYLQIYNSRASDEIKDSRALKMFFEQCGFMFDGHIVSLPNSPRASRRAEPTRPLPVMKEEKSSKSSSHPVTKPAKPDEPDLPRPQRPQSAAQPPPPPAARPNAPLTFSSYVKKQTSTVEHIVEDVEVSYTPSSDPEAAAVQAILFHPQSHADPPPPYEKIRRWFLDRVRQPAPTGKALINLAEWIGWSTDFTARVLHRLRGKTGYAGYVDIFERQYRGRRDNTGDVKEILAHWGWSTELPQQTKPVTKPAAPSLTAVPALATTRKALNPVVSPETLEQLRQMKKAHESFASDSPMQTDQPSLSNKRKMFERTSKPLQVLTDLKTPSVADMKVDTVVPKPPAMITNQQQAVDPVSEHAEEPKSRLLKRAKMPAKQLVYSLALLMKPLPFPVVFDEQLTVALAEIDRPPACTCKSALPTADSLKAPSIEFSGPDPPVDPSDFSMVAFDTEAPLTVLLRPWFIKNIRYPFLTKAGVDDFATRSGRTAARIRESLGYMRKCVRKEGRLPGVGASLPFYQMKRFLARWQFAPAAASAIEDTSSDDDDDDDNDDDDEQGPATTDIALIATDRKMTTLDALRPWFVANIHSPFMRKQFVGQVAMRMGKKSFHILNVLTSMRQWVKNHSEIPGAGEQRFTAAELEQFCTTWTSDSDSESHSSNDTDSSDDEPLAKQRRVSGTPANASDNSQTMTSANKSVPSTASDDSESDGDVSSSDDACSADDVSMLKPGGSYISILQPWFIKNVQRPFMSAKAARNAAELTGLSPKQVLTAVANLRTKARRLKRIVGAEHLPLPEQQQIIASWSGDDDSGDEDVQEGDEDVQEENAGNTENTESTDDNRTDDKQSEDADLDADDVALISAAKGSTFRAALTPWFEKHIDAPYMTTQARATVAKLLNANPDSIRIALTQLRYQSKKKALSNDPAADAEAEGNDNSSDLDSESDSDDTGSADTADLSMLVAPSHGQSLTAMMIPWFAKHVHHPYLTAAQMAEVAARIGRPKKAIQYSLAHLRAAVKAGKTLLPNVSVADVQKIASTWNAKTAEADEADGGESDDTETETNPPAVIPSDPAALDNHLSDNQVSAAEHSARTKRPADSSLVVLEQPLSKRTKATAVAPEIARRNKDYSEEVEKVLTRLSEYMTAHPEVPLGALSRRLLRSAATLSGIYRGSISAAAAETNCEKVAAFLDTAEARTGSDDMDEDSAEAADGPQHDGTSDVDSDATEQYDSDDDRWALLASTSSSMKIPEGSVSQKSALKIGALGSEPMLSTCLGDADSMLLDLNADDEM
eukprot:TRINITY_DN76_c0_g1_i1.p1 TRINITY_DN76_c0_g1~~TRINITY_DN76_c0_g1_i1.p1  ORF type:complete len:1456 (-),score=276.40 TRINITY_DN76_c0_g1_i1:717-5084(-)